MEPVGFSSEREAHWFAVGLQGGLDCFRVLDQGDRGAVDSLRKEETNQFRAITGAAGPGVVADVDDEERLAVGRFGEGTKCCARVCEGGETPQELRPAFLGRCGEVVCQARGQVRIVVRGDEDAEPGVGDVRWRKPSGDGHVDYPGAASRR